MNAMPRLSSGLSATARGLLDLIVIPILSFFLLKDGPKIRDALVALLFYSDERAVVANERRRAVEAILRMLTF